MLIAPLAHSFASPHARACLIPVATGLDGSPSAAVLVVRSDRARRVSYRLVLTLPGWRVSLATSVRGSASTPPTAWLAPDAATPLGALLAHPPMRSFNSHTLAPCPAESAPTPACRAAALPQDASTRAVAFAPARTAAPMSPSRWLLLAASVSDPAGRKWAPPVRLLCIAESPRRSDQMTFSIRTGPGHSFGFLSGAGCANIDLGGGIQGVDASLLDAGLLS